MNAEDFMNENPGSWTDAQRKLLFKLFADGNVKVEDVERLLFPLSELSVKDASRLIDCMKNKGDLSGTIIKIKDEREEREKRDKLLPAAQPNALVQQEKKKTEFVVQPGSELALARTIGIPDELANLFFMKLNGSAYIKVAGLQYIAGKIGYQRIEITEQYDDQSKTWIAEAKIYPKITVEKLMAISKLSPDLQKIAYEDMAKPTNGMGTANRENVQNSNMHKFLREMAQTRALGRALRSYTGYGSTTYEELPDATVEAD